MAFFSRIVLSLDWLVALAWLWRVLTWRRMIQRVPDLTRGGWESPSSGSCPLPPRLTVIVPARNEAKDIAATLNSLLDSRGVNLEIIAVDDRSQDGTGAIMDRIADRIVEGIAQGDMEGIPLHAGTAGNALQVLHVAELPSGWLGKTHAMAMAARHASGEWLLFTDGDVLFHPDALRRALDFALSSQADHLVLMPTLVLKSWGEHMLLSFLCVMSIWPLRLWRIPDRRSRRDAIGVGAFNMIRRPVYDALGGWEALRMEVLEDLALGLRVKRKGFAQRAALGRGLVRVRWAEGASGAVENMAKNLFAPFHFRAVLLLGFLPLFLLFTVFPLAALFAGAGAYWATGVMICAVFAAYRGQAKYQQFSGWEVALFPVAAALMVYTLLRSMAVVLARGGIFWRGTFYPLSELRQRGKNSS